MHVSIAHSSGVSALQRLWTRWVEGYVPSPETSPLPADPHRLGIPSGIALPGPAAGGWALDYYRRRLWWRTTAGAEMFRFKYRGDTDSGWRLVHAADGFLRSNLNVDFLDTVIPVPGNPVFREFEPTRWLADRFAQLLGKQIFIGIFSLARLGVPQKGITSARMKRKNIAGMYAIAADQCKHISGRRVLLVDDVCDSGHTLGELRSVLRDADAREVIPFAFVRVRHIGQQQ
jgi:hypothetical protein